MKSTTFINIIIIFFMIIITILSYNNNNYNNVDVLNFNFGSEYPPIKINEISNNNNIAQDINILKSNVKILSDANNDVNNISNINIINIEINNVKTIENVNKIQTQLKMAAKNIGSRGSALENMYDDVKQQLKVTSPQKYNKILYILKSNQRVTYVNEQNIKTCNGEQYADKIILGNNKIIYVKHIFIQTTNKQTFPHKCLLLSKIHDKEYEIVKYKHDNIEIQYKQTKIYNAVSDTKRVTIDELNLMDLSLKRINLKNVYENLKTINVYVNILPINVYISRTFVLLE